MQTKIHAVGGQGAWTPSRVGREEMVKRVVTEGTRERN